MDARPAVMQYSVLTEQGLLRLGAAGTPEEKLIEMVSAMGNMFEMTKSLACVVESLPGGGGRGRPLSENKSVSNLKMLGSNREEYKEWNDKLINSISMIKGTKYRNFLIGINRGLDID